MSGGRCECQEDDDTTMLQIVRLRAFADRVSAAFIVRTELNPAQLASYTCSILRSVQRETDLITNNILLDWLLNCAHYMD